jgi:hypothetical protein
MLQQSRTFTFPQSCTLTLPQSCTLTLPQSCTLTLPQSCTLTLPQSCTLTLQQSRTLTLLQFFANALARDRGSAFFLAVFFIFCLPLSFTLILLHDLIFWLVVSVPVYTPQCLALSVKLWVSCTFLTLQEASLAVTLHLSFDTAQEASFTVCLCYGSQCFVFIPGPIARGEGN